MTRMQYQGLIGKTKMPHGNYFQIRKAAASLGNFATYTPRAVPSGEVARQDEEHERHQCEKCGQTPGRRRPK